MFWARSDKGYGVKVEEYNGKFSLVPAQEKDGKWYYEWVMGKHWDANSRTMAPDEKEKPAKIFIGEKEKLIEFAKAILDEFDSAPF